MKTVTVVYDGARVDPLALIALIEAGVAAAGIEARVQDGADLAQFTDDEIRQAAVDRCLIAL